MIEVIVDPVDVTATAQAVHVEVTLPGVQGIPGPPGDAGDGGTPATWQAWTPTQTLWTVGNGSLVARYVRDGDLVHFYVRLTFGTTTVIASGPQTLTLPFPPKTPRAVQGYAACRHQSYDSYMDGALAVYSDGRVVPYSPLGYGSSMAGTNWEKNWPRAWDGDANSWWVIAGTYEAETEA